MEVKQFYNCSISPLVTKTFSVKWSEDNRLSIVTEKGVHIFEIIPSPMQSKPILNLSRSFIYSPECLPGDFYSNDILVEIYNWSKEDIYSFLMHSAYTPNFPDASKMIPEITDVFWSPRKLMQPQRCIIAIINSAGALELALEIDKNWISIYEVTLEWIKVIDAELKKLRGSKKLDHNSLKDQLQRLLITTATWSDLYDMSFAYLVTAHRNSEISIWKVNRIMSDVIDKDINVEIELKFNLKIINENMKINTLLWIHLSEKNYLIITGFYNGQIGCLKLVESEGVIISSSYTTCYSDIDNISVDNLQVSRQTDKWLELVVIKGMHLVVIVLDILGKLISMKFISSPGFSITGLSLLDPSTFLITTQDGNLSIVKKSYDQKELICTPIKADILKSSVQFLGLAHSSNKVLFTLITSPSMLYDHLTDRDPSNVCFFSLENMPSLNPIDLLNSNKEKSLLHCWDCLELVKINSIKHNKILENLSTIAVDAESLSLHKLRIAFWTLNINETKKIKNSVNVTRKPVELITELKSYIFLNSALNRLSFLIQQENVSCSQKLCMSLLKNHLDIWLAGEEEEIETSLSQRIKKVLEVANKLDLTKQEKCNFCNVIITEPWASTCSAGHKLPRCGITCLQVTCTKFRSCSICQEIFHPSLDIEMDEVMCLYCDIPAMYKYQPIDPSLSNSKRNLSKKYLSDTNNKNFKEDEAKDDL